MPDSSDGSEPAAGTRGDICDGSAIGREVIQQRGSEVTRRDWLVGLDWGTSSPSYASVALICACAGAQQWQDGGVDRVLRKIGEFDVAMQAPMLDLLGGFSRRQFG